MDKQPTRARLIDNPWFVLALLFGVTGVLGVPVLLHSRAFSTATKCLLTLVVTVYTFVLVAVVALIVYWAWGRIEQAL